MKKKLLRILFALVIFFSLTAPVSAGAESGIGEVPVGLENTAEAVPAEEGSPAPEAEAAGPAQEAEASPAEGDAAGGEDADAPDAEETTGDEDADAPDAEETAGEENADAPDGEETAGEEDADAPDTEETTGDEDADAPDAEETAGGKDTDAPDGEETAGGEDADAPDAEETAGGKDTDAPDAEETAGEEDADTSDTEETAGGENADAPGNPAAVGGEQTAGASGQSGGIETVSEKVETDNSALTAIMAGISADNKEMIVNGLKKYIDDAMKENVSIKITDAALPDAEKYMLSGYDEQLCWAATAANMLWTSNVAQASVNPDTKANFQTVDEVFNYFRKIFTDVVGRPDGAIAVFMKGADGYPFKETAGVSQLKKEYENVSKCLQDDVKAPDYGVFQLEDTGTKDIAKFENLKVQSLGVLLHSYNNLSKEMGALAHWVTSPGIIIDEAATGNARYKAILIADSDNDAVDPDGRFGNSMNDSQKAACAANAPNRYIVYPLTLKTYSNIGQRWTIPYYTDPSQASFDVLIDWAAYLGVFSPQEKDPAAPASPTAPAQSAESSSAGSGGDQYDLNWDEVDWDEYYWVDFDWDEFDWNDFDWEDMEMDILDAFLEKAPLDQILEPLIRAQEQAGDSGFLSAVRHRMAENEEIVYSPAEWNYILSRDTTFLVFVRTDPTMLLNVFLDGRLLTAYLKNFEVIDENTGTFLLVFSEEVMQGLDVGEHTLTLDLTGIGEVVRTIRVGE